jgi:hypothetical protein
MGSYLTNKEPKSPLSCHGSVRAGRTVEPCLMMIKLPRGELT